MWASGPGKDVSGESSHQYDTLSLPRQDLRGGLHLMASIHTGQCPRLSSALTSEGMEASPARGVISKDVSCPQLREAMSCRVRALDAPCKANLPQSCQAGMGTQT